MSEKEAFFARLERDYKRGLCDVKFCITPGSNADENDIYAASNRFDQAIEAGNFKEFDRWPYDRQAVRVPLLAD